MFCLFQCMDTLGCRNKVVNKVAFHPPKATYIFQPIGYFKSLTCSYYNKSLKYSNDSIKSDPESLKQSEKKVLKSDISPRKSQRKSKKEPQFLDIQIKEDNEIQESEAIMTTDPENQQNYNICKNLEQDFIKLDEDLQEQQQQQQQQQKDESLSSEQSGKKQEQENQQQQQYDEVYIENNNNKNYNSNQKQSKLRSSAEEKDFMENVYCMCMYDDFTKCYEEVIPEAPDIQIFGYKIQSESGNEIAGIHIVSNPHQAATENNLIIYSHGNSTDLGIMISQYLTLAENLNVNIFAYDYSGYGLSTGQANDINSLMDIKSVYKFVTETLEYEWHQIFLYGQSIGSGPSIFLGSRREYPVAGVIVHSGFTSGLRISVGTMSKTHQKDLFPNIDLVKYINCPVYIIHGKKDRIVPIEQAYELQRAVRNKHPPNYLQNAGHNNIEYSLKFKGEYIHRLKHFVKSVLAEQTKYTKKKLLRKNIANYWNDEFEHFYCQLHPIVRKSVPTMSSSFFSSQEAFLRTQNITHKINNSNNKSRNLDSQMFRSSMDRSSSIFPDQIYQYQEITDMPCKLAKCSYNKKYYHKKNEMTTSLNEKIHLSPMENKKRGYLQSYEQSLMFQSRGHNFSASQYEYHRKNTYSKDKVSVIKSSITLQEKDVEEEEDDQIEENKYRNNTTIRKNQPPLSFEVSTPNQLGLTQIINEFEQQDYLDKKNKKSKYM